MFDKLLLQQPEINISWSYTSCEYHIAVLKLCIFVFVSTIISKKVLSCTYSRLQGLEATSKGSGQLSL